MTVKVEGKKSKLRNVNAGAPQGSVLGTYIFNIGTDRLEDDFKYDTNTLTYELDQGDLAFLDTMPETQGTDNTYQTNQPPTHSALDNHTTRTKLCDLTFG